MYRFRKRKNGHETNDEMLKSITMTPQERHCPASKKWHGQTRHRTNKHTLYGLLKDKESRVYVGWTEKYKNQEWHPFNSELTSWQRQPYTCPDAPQVPALSHLVLLYHPPQKLQLHRGSPLWWNPSWTYPLRRCTQSEQIAFHGELTAWRLSNCNKSKEILEIKNKWRRVICDSTAIHACNCQIFSSTLKVEKYRKSKFRTRPYRYTYMARISNWIIKSNHTIKIIIIHINNRWITSGIIMSSCPLPSVDVNKNHVLSRIDENDWSLLLLHFLQ